jgi:hypothetical protein
MSRPAMRTPVMERRPLKQFSAAVATFVRGLRTRATVIGN